MFAQTTSTAKNKYCLFVRNADSTSTNSFQLNISFAFHESAYVKYAAFYRKTCSSFTILNSKHRAGLATVGVSTNESPKPH